MAYALKYGLFEKMSTPADVLKLMKQDMKNCVGKSVKFVAAKNYQIGGKAMNLFIATDTPNDFENFLKKKGATVATGEAKIALDDGKATVFVKSAKGSLNSSVIASMIPVIDNSMKGTVDGGPNVPDMVKRSHDQARKEGKLDWEFKPEPQMIHQLAMVGLETAEYQKFAAAFKNFVDDYKLKNATTVPIKIWSDLIQGLAKSGYVKSAIPNTGDPDKFILAFKGSDGKPVREKLLASAMQSLNKFVGHASTYLDKVITELTKGGSKLTWAFWSGTGAQAAAKAEANGGIVLEGTVGSWFDKVWQFGAFTGVEDLALWASVSEMYAIKAAESYAQFKFVGYLGPGSTRDQSVFNKIEQPTFVQVLNVKKTVPAPTIDWFVVDCEQPSGSTQWNWTKKPSTKSASRAEALNEIVRRYKA